MIASKTSSESPMFSASIVSSMNAGIGMISSSTVRNSAPVKIRSARFSSNAIEPLGLALILNRRLHPPCFQPVEIITVCAVNHRENLRDGLIKFTGDRLPHFPHREQQPRHGFIFDRRNTVFGRD